MGFNADLVLVCNTPVHGPTVLVIELKTTYVDDPTTRSVDSPKMNEYQRQAAMQALAVSFALQDSDETVIPIVVLVHVPRSVEELPRTSREAGRKGCRTTSIIGNSFTYKSPQARQIVADMIDTHVTRAKTDRAKKGFGLVDASGNVVTSVAELRRVGRALVKPRYRAMPKYPWANEMF
jgi:hypothetical protein